MDLDDCISLELLADITMDLFADQDDYDRATLLFDLWDMIQARTGGNILPSWVVAVTHASSMRGRP